VSSRWSAVAAIDLTPAVSAFLSGDLSDWWNRRR
jgi:hypothetical protein